MTFWILFFVAMAVGAGLKVWTKRTWISIVTPVILFVGYLLFNEYVMPYRGGGASMWPIAVMFGAPVALIGAIIGVFIVAPFVGHDHDDRGAS